MVKKRPLRSGVAFMTKNVSRETNLSDSINDIFLLKNHDSQAFQSRSC